MSDPQPRAQVSCILWFEGYWVSQKLPSPCDEIISISPIGMTVTPWGERVTPEYTYVPDRNAVLARVNSVLIHLWGIVEVIYFEKGDQNPENVKDLSK